MLANGAFESFRPAAQVSAESRRMSQGELRHSDARLRCWVWATVADEKSRRWRVSERRARAGTRGAQAASRAEAGGEDLRPREPTSIETQARREVLDVGMTCLRASIRASGGAPTTPP